MEKCTNNELIKTQKHLMLLCFYLKTINEANVAVSKQSHLKILNNVFAYLSYRELLTARSVSKKWNRAADRVLKMCNNFVFLVNELAFNRMTEKLDEFKNSNKILIYNKFCMVFEEIALENYAVQTFLELHGSSITQIKLQFKPDCKPTENTANSFRKLLEDQLPNLESLQIFGIPNHLWEEHDMFNETRFDGYENYLLPKLDTLGLFAVVSYSESYLCPLYSNFLRCLPPVRKFAVNWTSYFEIFLKEACAEIKKNRLRNFLSKVTQFSTVYDVRKCQTDMPPWHPEIFQPIEDGRYFSNLAFLCPQLNKLRFCFGKEVLKRDFEYLMRRLAGNLEFLELSGDGKWHSNNTKIEIPKSNENKTQLSDVIFSKLESLIIEENIFLSSEIFGELLPKSFPIMDSLIIPYVPEMFKNTVWKDGEGHRLTSLTIEGIPVKSGNEYDLGIYSRIFPALKILKTNVPNNEVLRNIYVNFPNLEELNIFGGFNDAGICGIPQFHCDNNHHIVDMQTVQTDEFLSLRDPVPHIGVMKNLQKLRLTSNLTTMSALYGFAELTNLKELCVEFCLTNDSPAGIIYFMPTLKFLDKLVNFEVSRVYLMPSEWDSIKSIPNMRILNRILSVP